MKFLVGTYMSFLLKDKQAQRNIRALLKYVLFLVIVVSIYTTIFHYLKLLVEGEYYTWVTGIYWTLTVMSTLGFGDITFTTDVGRAFSMMVLISGVILLLVVLPFAFIRYFYAPWLEAQIHMRAPRRLAETVKNHVVICEHDVITPGLIQKLRVQHIPYCVISPDPTEAARLHGDGISVVTGEIDSRLTYEAVGADRARLIVANSNDAQNANIALTIREVAPDVHIVAVATAEDSVDILELTGCNDVLPLKRWLGEQLANRVNAVAAQTHVIGKYRDLLIAELPVHHTPLVGKTIRDSRLREIAGVSVISVWERGQLKPARADTMLTDISVPVLIGTEEQLERLDTLFAIYDINPSPIIVIGGGKVGRAAARALKKREVMVHVVERNEAMQKRIEGIPDEIFIGDATDRELLMRAGVLEAPSVVLTTNDDAMNIYLAAYCRRLNPELRIVSRITHERNIEAIHRAGADFVLSYASLGVGAIFSLLHGRELVILGEGIDFFYVPLPRKLFGKTLAESGIGARTGMNVIAVQLNGEIITNPPPVMPLQPGSELLMLGNPDQRKEFSEAFG